MLPVTEHTLSEILCSYSKLDSSEIRPFQKQSLQTVSTLKKQPMGICWKIQPYPWSEPQSGSRALTKYIWTIQGVFRFQSSQEAMWVWEVKDRRAHVENKFEASNVSGSGDHYRVIEGPNSFAA